MRAVLSGIGWVTAAGIGRGRHGDAFGVMNGPLPKLTRKTALDHPYDRFGRMDEYSKLGLTAIAFALQDADLAERRQGRSIGLIASTLHGCLKTDLDYYDTVKTQGGLLASPHLFAYTLPNSFLGEAAIVFGLSGTSYVIMESSPWGLTALRLALLSLAGQEHEMMLAGVCDTGGRPPFTTKEACLPGAVFLLLERESRSRIRPYGSVVLDEEGAVFFNGAEKGNIIELVQGCLKGHANQNHLSQLA